MEYQIMWRWTKLLHLSNTEASKWHPSWVYSWWRLPNGEWIRINDHHWHCAILTSRDGQLIGGNVIISSHLMTTGSMPMTLVNGLEEIWPGLKIGDLYQVIMSKQLVTCNSCRFEQTFLVFSLGERGETGAFWVDLSNVDDRSAFKFSNGEIPEDYFWAEDKPSET